ncbi:MAG: retroviral-like aspartic protease family protein [Paracoccaceae bacterium]|nr:MAG: retroviral-like aspartic protease family protein [Paracoccaceae bacterium]
MDGTEIGRLAYLVLLLAAVGGWAMMEYRGRLGFALRTAMAWGFIFLGVIAGYGLWQDIRSTALSVQSVSDSGRIEVPRGADGHFHLTLDIAGTSVRFLVDTGATNVVLGRADAARLGIYRNGLAFTGTANTANGTVRTARVQLADVTLGPFRDDRIAAYVTDGEMEGSLLGMDYLRRYRIEIAGNRMVLTR